MQIVLHLIVNGANVNTGGGEHKHALLAAILSKKFALVPALRLHKASLDPKLLQRAFFTVSARGSLDGDKTLLELGAKVNSMNDRKQTALDMAIAKRHRSIVECLMRHGGEVNAQGDLSHALQTASCYSHEKVVQMLLDKGIDANAYRGDYGNALQAALRGGREKVVQTLVPIEL